MSAVDEKNLRWTLTVSASLREAGYGHLQPRAGTEMALDERHLPIPGKGLIIAFFDI
jgi:hypothetical protein